MASNDPTDTGGLFVGRRPGTAPVRYAATSRRSRAPPPRRRAAGLGLLALEMVLCLSLFGPQPLALALGRLAGRVPHRLRDGRHRTIMLGCLASLLLTLALAKRVDHAWKLVRRAGGHHQERGALERIFAVERRRGGSWPSRSGSCSSRGPGPTLAPDAASAAMGFRDYYRQFEDIDEEELNQSAASAARAKGAGARAGARPRPVRHRVARAAPLRGRERRDRTRPRPRERLPRPPREPRAPPAGRAPRGRAGADRARQRSRGAAAGGRAGAAVGRATSC